MSRTVQSPVKRFPGEVQLPDYLDFPTYARWREAMQAAQAFLNDKREAAKAAGQERFSYDQREYNRLALPGICAVVEKWNLAGLKTPVTPDTFPVTPSQSANALAEWLIREISSLFDEAEDTDPN